jgi:hypothetical protein
MPARTLRLTALLALALAAASALADTVTTNIYNSGNQTGDAGLVTVTIGKMQIDGLGGNFSGSSGVIGGATVAFPWLFCIDALDDITLPGSYTAAYTTDGTANGKPVNNAAQIAWLILNLAPPVSSLEQNVGLQLAIWSLIYSGNGFSVQSAPPGALAAMSADLAALGSHTAPVNQLYWITPTTEDGDLAQELVAPITTVTPEPGTIALLSTGLLALATRTHATTRVPHLRRSAAKVGSILP